MFRAGDRIKYYGKDAIILSCMEEEVLLFVHKDYVKWVDKSLIELQKTA